jgi:GAF domain-containing protein/anti-sigma regulatory factor (Ser/Thr protein kinase)
MKQLSDVHDPRLQLVTDAALAYLSEDDLLDELLTRITQILSTDTAAVLLLEPDGKMLRARAARGIEEEVEQGVRIPVGGGFAGRVAAERRAITIEEVDHANVLNPILREKGIRSLLGVPLLIEGRVIGVLHVGTLTPRRFTADDRDLLQLAADRAALAIEHARLYAQERTARENAERASQRLEALQRVTDAALGYLSEEELLDELLRRISEILDSDTAAILLLEPDGATLRPRAARGIEEEVERGVRIPVGRGFAGRVAAERRAITIEDVDHGDVLNPILREKGIHSLLGVPMLIEGRVLGVLHVGTLQRRRFTAEDRDLLQLAADRAALAIEHAKLYEQRRLAEVLQRRLLPERLPQIPGLEIASRYMPAAAGGMGGDWYDVFNLGRGRIALAVGDVVGHGVGAAAVMAQLRTALRAYAVLGMPPAEVVQAVNRLMWQLGPSSMTTLAYLVLDPAEATLELVNAGHPPPLLVQPDGEASFLPLQGTMALGVSGVAAYHSDTIEMPLGATVVLYTDGLVEERGRSIDDGLERLRQLSAGRHQVEGLCSLLVERMVPDAPPDDIAIVAAHVPPLPDHLSTTWPADPDVLADLRRLLRRWLTARGATADEAYDITVACQEACANAIEHAYGPGRAEIEVELHHEDGRARVTVRDHGRWRPARGENRGRGLPLMHSLMHTVDVSHGERGTVVVLERTLEGGAA